MPYGEIAQAPSALPFKDDSQLGLYETYDFKGWSSSIGGELVDLSTITVTSDEEFYAIFEKVDDVRKIVHYDWFEATPYDYDEAQWEFMKSNYKTCGLMIYPKGHSTGKPLALRGKITIPRRINGVNVIGLGSFPESDGHEITHVFMEDDGSGTRAPLTMIGSRAFQFVETLKYFDFANSSVRFINTYAFQRCSLDMNLMSFADAPLRGVNGYVFNQGFTASTPTTVHIPATLIYAGSSAFQYGFMPAGSNLQIGDPDNMSILDLSYSVNASSYEKFVQKEAYLFTNVDFYSAVYETNAWDTILYESGNDKVTVQKCFGYISGAWNLV